jgi:hypothetical protein
MSDFRVTSTGPDFILSDDNHDERCEHCGRCVDLEVGLDKSHCSHRRRCMLYFIMAIVTSSPALALFMLYHYLISDLGYDTLRKRAKIGWDAPMSKITSFVIFFRCCADVLDHSG